jgi:tripeptide aminopeptidase
VAEEEIATVHVLVRDFGEDGLREKEQLLEKWARETEGEMPGVKVEIDIKQSYRNMKQELDRHPQVMKLAEEAVRAAGLEPIKRPIRGGTDGAVLTAKGLPTPNIFTGGHAYHSKREWASLDIMCKTVETCLHLVRLWAEKGEKKRGS